MSDQVTGERGVLPRHPQHVGKRRKRLAKDGFQIHAGITHPVRCATDDAVEQRNESNKGDQHRANRARNLKAQGCAAGGGFDDILRFLFFKLDIVEADVLGLG